MLTPEERAILTDMQDQLIELYVAKDEAAGHEDWGQVRELDGESIRSPNDARKSARSMRLGAG